MTLNNTNNQSVSFYKYTQATGLKTYIKREKLLLYQFNSWLKIILYCNIIMLHCGINKWRQTLILLHVEIIYLVSRGQKYATLEISQWDPVKRWSLCPYPPTSNLKFCQVEIIILFRKPQNLIDNVLGHF